MAYPNFLNLRLIAIIRPAIALLHTLMEMRNLAELAVLTVREGDKIQIFTVVPNQRAIAFLDMNSISMVSPSNPIGYSLVFRIQNWYDRLIYMILVEPSASLHIRKLPGSNNLSCFFGVQQKLIRLGDAIFIEAPVIDMKDNDLFVRVTMRSQQFIVFVMSFADSGHDHNIPQVQLRINRENIRWITPSGHHDHSAQEYAVEGLEAGTGFQFGLRWDLALFQRLCWIASCYDHVVISVFKFKTTKLYGFRFLHSNSSYSYTYMEKELVPQHPAKKQKNLCGSSNVVR